MGLLEKRIEDIKKRQKLARTFAARIIKIDKSEAEFCAEYKFPQSLFNRIKNEKREEVPRWSTLHKFDAALKVEERKIARRNARAKKNAQKG